MSCCTTGATPWRSRAGTAGSTCAATAGSRRSRPRPRAAVPPSGSPSSHSRSSTATHGRPSRRGAGRRRASNPAPAVAGLHRRALCARRFFMRRGACFVTIRDRPSHPCGVAVRAAPYGVLRAASGTFGRPSEEAFVVTRIPLLTLALATLVGVAAVSAQQRQITGRVTSGATNEPVAGVTVSVTGTAFAAVTNAEGRYAIAAPAGAVTLVFRRIAFKRREVAVPADQNAADVTLDPDVFNLEAVVVTGQATGVERRNAAIATTNVTGEETSRVPAPSIDRALAGRVPGAIISQNSGAPGGGTQIQLRGNNTVIGNPDPLFVVDGVIYSDVALPTGLFTVTGSSANRGNGELQDDPVNRLADLNPNDVESTEILRGAAASSIYGSKAANGVIVIKTNHGRAGKPRATITQSLGFF